MSTTFWDKDPNSWQIANKAPLRPGVAAAAPSAAPGYQGPNWEQLLANDPLYKQLQADLSAQGVSDAAQRAAATKRALIAFGLAPDFASSGLNQGFLSQDVDAATLETARNNPFSITKRLEQAFKDSLVGLRTSLRQRGAVRSGEQGYGLQRAQTGFDQGQYDSLQRLLEYLGGVQGSFTTGERNRQWQLYQALLAALGRQTELNQGGPAAAPGTAAATNPAPVVGASGDWAQVPGKGKIVDIGWGM